MSQLPTVIRDRLDELATVYAERLCEHPTYAAMSAQARLDSTRTFLSFVAACLEARDEAMYLQFMQGLIDERVKQGFGLEPLLLALNVLEELIAPLVNDLEDVTFLWRALSKGRNALVLRMAELMRASEARLEQDLAERRQTEEQLQYLARAVESTHDAVVITDVRGNIQFVNPAFEQITGYSRAEALGYNPRLLKSGLQSGEFYARMWQTITSGEVWEGEVTNRRKDGSLYHARLTISPMRNAAGEVEQFVATQHDITAQKEAEAQARFLMERRAEQVRTSTEVAQEIAAAPELEDLFHRVVTLIKERFGYYHAQIFQYDADADAVVLSAGYGETGAAMRATGHRLPVGHGIVGVAAATRQPVLAPDVAQNPNWIPNPHLPATQGELAVPIKLRGELLGVLDVQSDRAGALTQDDQLLLEGLCGQIAIAIDTTNLLTEVQRSADLLRSVLDATPDWIFVKDQNFRYTLVNRGYASALHLHTEDMIGRDDLELGFPEELVYGNPDKGIRGFRTDDTAVLQRGETIINPFDPATIDGEIHVFHTFKTPLRNTEGDIVGVLGLARDITDRQQAEARLAEERNLLRTVIDNVPARIYVKDAESRFVLANAATMRAMGVTTPEELIGKTDFDFFPKELASSFFEAEQAIINTGQPVIGEEDREPAMGPGDAPRIVMSTKVPLYNAQGQVAGLVGIGLDMTEQKLTEARLAAERNLMRTLIDNVPDLIYAKDTECRFTLANTALLRQLGAASVEDVIGKSDFDFHPKELAEQYFAAEQEIMRSGRGLINHEEVAVDRATGNIQWYSSTKVPLYDASGNLIGLVGIGRDITERQQMEARLAEERNLLRTLVDNLPDVVYVKDTESRFLLLNDILARQLGAESVEAAIGKTDFDYYPREMAEAFFADDQRVVRFGEPVTREEPGRDAQGKPLWVLTTKAPLRDASGRVIGLVGIGRDITERRRQEAELQDRLAEINALYRAVSHEGWESFREEAELTTGYLFDRADVRPAEGLWEPEIALAAARATLVTAGDGDAKVVAPLAVRGGEVIGALGVYDDPENPLSPEDLTLIQSVSEQVALALDAARLFDQTQATLQETDVLYRASQALGAAEDEQAVLDAVARYAMENGALSATLSYIEVDDRGDPEWLDLAAVACAEGAPQNLPPIGTRLPVAGMPAAPLWLEDPDHPLILADVAADPRVPEDGRAAMQRQGWRCTVILPLQPGNRWVGLISLNWGEPQAFTERDRRIYQALLDQATVTLDSRRLLLESTQRAEDMRFLFEVTQTATSSTADLQSSLQSVVNVLRNFLQDAHADILIPEGTGDLRMVACSHFTDAIGALFARDTSTAIGWAAETLEPLVVEEGTVARYRDLSPETGSAMTLPIAAGGQLGGVIRLQSPRAGLFDAHTLQLLQTLSSALHAIIQNQRLLQEVTAANERLLEIDKLKSQFLANMSHELRTPLNSIIGFSRVMLKGIDGPLTELQQQDLETIHSSGQHLLNLINDVLDQSKLEAGKMELSCDYFQIGEVIKGVMSTGAALVKEKPIKLVQEVPADLPPVWGDEFRTRQVLLNLISNASKFTEEGSITVSARLTTDLRGKEIVVVSVADTGIGIAEKDMSKLFQAFQQVDSSMTRRVGGTGLGLPIAKSLIEMQGGTIWVESEVGVGSVFSFSIPLNPPPAQEEVVEEDSGPTPSLALDAKAPPRPSRIVMVLDDEAGVINLYRRYLTNQGYTVIGTTDPDELDALIAERRPHIILLDVIMPNRDGWAVLAALKQNPETRDIPVIVCTIVDERERGLAMGAAEYLVKPFVEADLVKSVERVESSLIGEGEA